MGLNKSKGNMYEFVTHTWNAIKGACSHDCSYCYMKRWGELNPIRLDEKELKTDLGSENFIFVGSSTDMFAEDVPADWIWNVLDSCKDGNKYLVQSKNPGRFHEFNLRDNFVVGATIETNRVYDFMGNTPSPKERAEEISLLKNKKFITVEPILDFDLDEFSDLLLSTGADWINIGADSGGHGMPEPSKEKVQALIDRLTSKITIKKNMKRITGGDK